MCGPGVPQGADYWAGHGPNADEAGAAGDGTGRTAAVADDGPSTTAFWLSVSGGVAVGEYPARPSAAAAADADLNDRQEPPAAAAAKPGFGSELGGAVVATGQSLTAHSWWA